MCVDEHLYSTQNLLVWWRGDGVTAVAFVMTVTQKEKSSCMDLDYPVASAH